MVIDEPALLLEPRSIEIDRTFRLERTFTKLAWKAGYFSGLDVIGSDLLRHRVVRVVDVEPVTTNPLRILSFEWKLLRGTLELGEGTRLTLDEVKRIVLGYMIADSYWDELLEDLETYRNRVSIAPTFVDIVDALTPS